MILTHESYEVKNVSRLFGEGQRMWRAVTLELFMPYFLVRYSTLDGGARVSETAIVWRDEDLAEFCGHARDDEDYVVLEVARLSPPVDELRERWKIEALGEVWIALDRWGQRVTLLVLENGDQVLAKGRPYSSDEVRIVERVFP